MTCLKLECHDEVFSHTIVQLSAGCISIFLEFCFSFLCWTQPFDIRAFFDGDSMCTLITNIKRVSYLTS